jgi:hypothetical protein
VLAALDLEAAADRGTGAFRRHALTARRGSRHAHRPRAVLDEPDGSDQARAVGTRSDVPRRARRSSLPLPERRMRWLIGWPSSTGAGSSRKARPTSSSRRSPGTWSRSASTAPDRSCLG